MTSEATPFDRVLTSLRSVQFRPEMSVEEGPAPQRLAPHAVALTAEFIEDDELVEITPKSIRLRKRHLTESERKRAGR